MVTAGYTLDLICDCSKCRTTQNHYEIATGEYTGDTYSECARQAKKEGWRISKDKIYCSAPNHEKFSRV